MGSNEKKKTFVENIYWTRDTVCFRNTLSEFSKSDIVFALSMRKWYLGVSTFVVDF